MMGKRGEEEKSSEREKMEVKFENRVIYVRFRPRCLLKTAQNISPAASQKRKTPPTTTSRGVKSGWRVVTEDTPTMMQSGRLVTGLNIQQRAKPANPPMGFSPMSER